MIAISTHSRVRLFDLILDIILLIIVLQGELVRRITMKKFWTIALVALMVFGLTACASPEKEQETGKEGTGGEIALITDVGTIDDGSFNQGSWEGVQSYVKEHNEANKDKQISATYYRPSTANDDEYYNTISKAIKDGKAKVIVTPGFLFNNAVFRAQKDFPDVNFIFVDSLPQENGDSEPVIGSNTNSLLYDEHESGFFAGYAAVKDGMTKLGFIGGYRVPAVEKYGIGYLYGADAAAKELGVDVEVRYNYANTFEPKPEVQTLAAGWYAAGTEVIFASAGGAGNSVFAAAQAANKKSIGVDKDQSADSETIITSAVKQLQGSVHAALKNHYEGKFEGGKATTYGIANDSVGLPDKFDRFETFTKADYDKIYADFKADKDGIRSSIPTTHANDFSDLKLEKVKIV